MCFDIRYSGVQERFGCDSDGNWALRTRSRIKCRRARPKRLARRGLLAESLQTEASEEREAAVISVQAGPIAGRHVKALDGGIGCISP